VGRNEEETGGNREETGKSKHFISRKVKVVFKK
jgi:hypothetical protein